MTRLLFALLVCAGCNGGGGSGGDGGPSGPPDMHTGISNPSAPVDDDAIAQYARDWCGFYLRCGLPVYTNLETCVDNIACSARGLLFATAPITRGQLLSCSRSIVSLACDATELPVDDSCMQLSGTVAEALGVTPGCNGETCERESYCERSDRHCPRCAPRAALGASCVGVECVSDGYCNTTTTRCEPVRALGAACDENAACRVEGIGPDSWNRCHEGVCSRPAKLGEPCDMNAVDCGLALTCLNGVCSEPKRAGEPCAGHGECLRWHSCVLGTCTEICGFKLQSIGEPCAFDLQCNAAFCDLDTSTCAALKAEGTSCRSSAQCNAALFCNPASNTCAARAGDGAACQRDDACISDFCNEQQCQQPICN
jgi:hypothetical protein